MKKRFFVGLLSAMLLISVLLPGTMAWADGKSDAAENAKSAVVRMLTEYADGSYSIASAFGVGKKGSAPEYFITNAHNCMEEDGSRALGIYILLDSEAVSISLQDGDPVADVDDSRIVACEVVNGDSITLNPDVAVLKAAEPVADRTCAALRKSITLENGQTVFALGYSEDPDILGLSRDGGSLSIPAGIDDVSVQKGKVSAGLQEEASGPFQDTDAIQHSASVTRGNSGGPTVDEDGAVVGINTWPVTDKNSGTDSDSSYSISIAYAVEILQENDIEFEFAKEGLKMNTRNIILLAAIAVIIIAAVILIIHFLKLGNAWQKEQAEKEAQELRLQGVSGYFAGRRFPLETQVAIGRDPGNNIVYPTDTNGVSANHCVVTKTSNQIYVKDISGFGTFLNGDTKLPYNQVVSVKVGDRISLGSEAETFMITRKGGRL